MVANCMAFFNPSSVGPVWIYGAWTLKLFCHYAYSISPKAARPSAGSTLTENLKQFFPKFSGYHRACMALINRIISFKLDKSIVKTWILGIDKKSQIGISIHINVHAYKHRNFIIKIRRSCGPLMLRMRILIPGTMVFIYDVEPDVHINGAVTTILTPYIALICQWKPHIQSIARLYWHNTA